ncbi:MAG: arginine--tRNA ligase [Cyclobacteriaceae bacterium]|nr:arginine--tRNA ligase [Cyclobacteriaceae bacterium]
MNLDQSLRTEIQKALTALFNQTVDHVQLQPTNQEFEGSHTLVCFPLAKISKKGPEETARLIGEYLVTHTGFVSRFNVVKGFLNLVIADRVWMEVFHSIYANKNFGNLPANDQEIMIEYSSPNTNKPLHLGHLRNNFLGYAVAEIYKALGYTVHKVQIINDRGIHICKSMAAWKLFGKGETPHSSGIKGDHLVGKYYVEFDKNLKAQVKDLIQQGVSEADAEKQAPIMQLAIDMLRKWEAKDPETVHLWKTMNGWVYEGFGSTYKRMGVDFDKLYYESETYLLGKNEVLRGLDNGAFFKKDDGSVWVDLTSDGLDQKVLLRSDGTSVYMTQDIGTAILRFRDFPKISRQVYTVGNEQEYHFKVLFLILAKLGYAWAKECYHLSYGMVDLPTGKMKSREGTVVDADDLMQEMVDEAEKQSRELGKIEEATDQQIKELSEMIGLGALKFFLLKVDPKKRMLFDPNESIQLQGHTGPFIQYTHARIRAIIRKAETMGISPDEGYWKNVNSLEPAEREVIFLISNYIHKLNEAARDYSPAVIANFAFDLAKGYNQFYQSIPIFNEADQDKLKFRIAFSSVVADVIKRAMAVLGIQVPERM